jgi:hypothetical protein
MTVISDPYNLNVQYLKLVNNTIQKRKEWSYPGFEQGVEFYLHWALNEDAKKSMSPGERIKKLLRKEKDAKKARLGESILLCQNHARYGHRVTHVVKTVTDTAEWNHENNEMWTRRVQVVRIPPNPWENNAPNTRNVIICLKKLPFSSGNLIRFNAPSIISLKLDQLNWQ